jgi:RNA polymerase subunit RPABC4/transcription elongation factor Spt4
MRAAGPDSLGRLLVSRLDTVWEAGKPITVEDLVDTLIPYHHVRSALGLTMKGEYDLGILHLLHSGEHVRVDAELAQAVERELATPEPDLGFLSNLAEARVEVRPEAWAQWSADTTPELLEGRPFPGEPATEATRPEGGSNGAPVDRLVDHRIPTREYIGQGSHRPDGVESPPSAPAPAKREAAMPSERCRHCQRILPERNELQFCPYCGVGQRDPTCAECGEQLERGWAYCPRCGKATET